MWDSLFHPLMAEGLQALAEIRSKTGNSWTTGLKDSIIREFLQSDPSLNKAIEEASINFQSLQNDIGSDVLKMDEKDLVKHLQSDYVNFYSAPTVNPYVAISARGP